LFVSLGREIVEYVRRVSASGQEHERRSGTAPIQHLQSDVPIHIDKSHAAELRDIPAWEFPQFFSLDFRDAS